MITAQSVNYVERFIADSGHTVQRVENDYGYDLILFTYDEDGYAEEGSVSLQLKASERLPESKAGYAFDMDVRDCNLWKSEPMPVILVLFDASRRRAYWLYVQRYFAENERRRPRHGAKTVRVYVPRRQAINQPAIARMRLLKQRILEQLEGVPEHAGDDRDVRTAGRDAPLPRVYHPDG